MHHFKSTEKASSCLLLECLVCLKCYLKLCTLKDWSGYLLVNIHTPITSKIMNSTEVQNPWRKLDVFGSVLPFAKSDHVFQKLS